MSVTVLEIGEKLSMMLAATLSSVVLALLEHFRNE
jgi:hypothetical protein